MKKNIITFIIILITLIPINIFAEEYRQDQNGNYSISDAYCSYKYDISGYDYEFSIYIKQEGDYNKIYNVEASFGKYNDYVYVNTLAVEDFFKNKEFKCPETIDVQFLPAGSPAGYYLERICNEEDIGGKCNRGKLTSDSSVKYNIKDPNEKDPIIEEPLLTCAFEKQNSSAGSTSAQNAAPKNAIYKKYKDKNILMDKNDNNRKYEIDSIDSCPVELYTKVHFENKEIKKFEIVDGCSEGDSKCVIYKGKKYANNPDETMNEDGTSERAPGSVEPSKVEISNIEFKESNCETLLGDTKIKGEPAYYLNFAFNLIKYAAIILLFVLTIIEYAKAVTASNQDAIIKASQTTVKRAIIAAIIFFLPILINFLLRLLGIISTNGTCGIGF